MRWGTIGWMGKGGEGGGGACYNSERGINRQGGKQVMESEVKSLGVVDGEEES